MAITSPRLVLLARTGTIHELPEAHRLTPGDEATARCGSAMGRAATLEQAKRLTDDAEVCKRCAGDDKATPTKVATRAAEPDES